MENTNGLAQNNLALRVDFYCDKIFAKLMEKQTIVSLFDERHLH